MRTSEQLKQIAVDLQAGRIFTDRHIGESEAEHLLSLVFMPIIFANKDLIESWKKNPPGLIFEYLSEAGPRAINGYPIFSSMRTLTQEETLIVFKIAGDIDKAIKSIPV